MRPGNKKVRAILEFPTPTDVHTARSFHGLASFFRRFVPGFATIAAPIIELFKKDEIFLWDERRNNAFQELKSKLGSQPVVGYFNPNAVRTELHTDASSIGLGAMLLQGDSGKELKLIYAISRRTSDIEKNYHSSKLELMAIVWSMIRLHRFLIGIKFHVITDCQALVHIDSFNTNNPQIVRWLNVISEYDFEIHHRPGAKMSHVDALSRAPVEEASDNLSMATSFNISVREDEIMMYQRCDELIDRKIKILEKDEKTRTRQEKGEVIDYILRDGMLFKKDLRDNDKELYVVPRPMRKALVIKNHDLSSHFGVERTVARIGEHYYFPRMRMCVGIFLHVSNVYLRNVNMENRQGNCTPFLQARDPYKRYILITLVRL